MVILVVVYVDIGVPLDGRSDTLVPSRVEDGRQQFVHASGVWVGLGLSTEHGKSKMT